MNIFKNFSRNFSANRQAYLINMLSLVPGLACCLLILLWLVFEVETDRFIPQIDKIAVVRGYHEGSQPFGGAPPAVAPALKQEFPEVADAGRADYAFEQLKYKNEKFDYYSVEADASVFSIFDIEFVEGEAFLDGENNKCVVSEKAAKSLFGQKSAIGQFVDIGDQQFAICGVMRNMPKNTTVGMELVVPLSRRGEGIKSWYNNSFVTYVLLKNAADFDVLKEKVKDRAFKEQPENKLYLDSYPLKDRYLKIMGNMGNVRLMAIIAVFVLLIACINFINLATAGFTKTSFQTGIRKVIGATRRGLILNNYANTSLLVILSFLIAGAVAVAILPWFNLMIERNFVPGDFLTPMIVWICVGVVGITILLAGTYPALYVASFNPLKVLKGRNGLGSGKNWFKNTLVVVQFSISIALIISTMVISKQIRMYQGMDLGYNRQEVLYVALQDNLAGKATVLKSELLKNPSIKAVSISQKLPTQVNWNGMGWHWDGMDPAAPSLVTFTYVDEDWLKVLDIKLKEGNFFEKGGSGVIINDKLAGMMGGTSLIDNNLNRGNANFRIVGVLDKFMFNNFKAELLPLAIFPFEDGSIDQMAEFVMVRAEGKNLSSIYDQVKQKAKELNGNGEVKVRFLDDSVNSMLYAEKQSARMVSFFSVLSIIISCLGLFGMAAFMMELKRKEIGVRRVNGAKVGEILWLLNINFLKPVLLGFIIACPLAYYFMSGWLETYLQRTELSWWIFALAGLVTAIVAVLTLVWKSWWAATENPVNALKSE